MVDMSRSDSETFIERPDFPRGKPPPSFYEFVSLVAKSTASNYLGMMRPLAVGCGPCTFNFDAVIHMETYDEDTR